MSEPNLEQDFWNTVVLFWGELRYTSAATALCSLVFVFVCVQKYARLELWGVVCASSDILCLCLCVSRRRKEGAVCSKRPQNEMKETGRKWQTLALWECKLLLSLHRPVWKLQLTNTYKLCCSQLSNNKSNTVEDTEWIILGFLYYNKIEET